MIPRPLFSTAIAVAALTGCQPDWPAGLALPDPEQTVLPADSPASFEHHGARFETKAAFVVEGVVLSTMRYRVGKHAGAVPLDVALGWGPMSDATVLGALRVRQNDRYFFWSSSGPLPIERQEIEHHAANVHLSWGKGAVGDVVLGLDAGDVVHLKGALVDVADDDGVLASSLVRTDVGGGACEVMWVDEARVID